MRILDGVEGIARGIFHAPRRSSDRTGRKVMPLTFAAALDDHSVVFEVQGRLLVDLADLQAMGLFDAGMSGEWFALNPNQLDVDDALIERDFVPLGLRISRKIDGSLEVNFSDSSLGRVFGASFKEDDVLSPRKTFRNEL